jgi:hypothetical protein
MPVNPNEEKDQHKRGEITDKLAQDSMTKSDPGASDHPIHDKGEEKKGDKVDIRYHNANPGPAIPEGFNVQQEGTKEDRQKRDQELNK